MKHIPLLAGLLSAALGSAASAEGWRDTVTEIGFGVIPVETQTQTTDTMDGFAAYASEKLGVPVKIFTATEFIGVNNALIAGQIDMAWTSPSAYAGSWIECGGCVEPMVAAMDKNGILGYNAVLIVKSDSSYQKFEDLEGKVVARTEPNSNSGYLVPTVEFARMGKPVDQFFDSPISGGHTQSVLGVLDGVYEAAFTWTTKGDGLGQLRMMMDKGLLDRSDIRVIWTSDLVPQSPLIVRSDMPEDMRAELTDLFVNLHKENMELAEAVAKGETQGFVPADHSMYESTVSLRKELRKLRKTN